MTLNGVMALILRYFIEFVVVKPTSVSESTFDSLWPYMICAIIQRLFGQNKLW